MHDTINPASRGRALATAFLVGILCVGCSHTGTTSQSRGDGSRPVGPESGRPVEAVARDLGWRLEPGSGMDRQLQAKDGSYVYLMADRPYFLHRGQRQSFGGRPAIWTGRDLLVSRELEAALGRVKLREPRAGRRTVVRSRPVQPRPPAPVAPLAGFSVVLDPGHGGRDSGAPDRGYGISEKDINLIVARSLAKRLRAAGARVVMTRDDDRYVALAARGQKANSERAAAFVSIHANAAGNRSASGIEVFVRGGERETAASRKLASDVLRQMIQATKARSRGVKTENWAVLRAANTPGILVELGFMTNEAEMRRLATPAYREKLVSGIADGVQAWWLRQKALRPGAPRS